MGIIDLIATTFDRILNAALHLFLLTMTSLENALRGPLQSVGIKGALQTLILMMIPVLTIVAVVKLFGGIVRLVVVVILVLVLAHILYPLVAGTAVQAP